MKRFLKFFREVKQEVAKVTWLSRKEVLTSTAMVVLVVAIFSLLFVITDYVIYHVIQFVVNLGV